jgi:hypothetical protein
MKVVAHLCLETVLTGGGIGFIRSFAELRRLNPRLQAGAEPEWIRVLAAVEAAGVAPVPWGEGWSVWMLSRTSGHEQCRS